MLKNKFIVIAVFLLFVFSLLVGGEIPFFIFYFIMSIIIISFISAVIYRYAINAKLNLNEGALYTGDEIEISYNIYNGGFFSIPYVEIKNLFERELTNLSPKPSIYSIEPKKTITKRVKITVKRRGLYELGEIKISVMDSLGIFKLSKTIKQTTSLLVYPSYRKLESFHVLAGLYSGELFTHYKKAEDRNRSYGARSYVLGDPVKSIHWKLSAKKDSLMTKEFESRSNTSVLIIIDSLSSKFKYDYDFHIEDSQVEISSSIIDFCLSHEIETALFFENNSKGKFISGKNIIDLNYFIDELAMYRPTGILSLSDNIDINFENFYKYSTIIFITNSLNKDDSKEILTLKMKGINPIIIYITDLENKAVDHDYSYLEILKLQSISIYELDYNSDFVKEMEAHYDERF